MRSNRDAVRRRSSMLFSAAICASLLFTSLPARATAQTTWNYVALGDSLAFGLWAFPGNSYVSRYRNYVQTDYTVTANLNNLGVNGWTSSDLLNALLTNSSYRTAVMGANVVTWDIGGNDLLDARSTYKSGSCGGADNQDCLRSALASIKTNWNAIMREILLLRSAGTILRTMDMYNPYVATDSSANTWPNDGGLNDYQAFKPYLDELNNFIRTTATLNGIPCARVQIAYNGVTGAEDAVGKGYIAFDGLHPNDAGHAIIATQMRTAAVIPRTRTIETYDFDGDAKTDLSVWRPSDGTWYTTRSGNGAETGRPWGSASLGDVPAPGDYDGDGKTDIAVFRQSNGTWYILNSSNDSIRIQPWGANGDRPVPGDYDGDGITDIAVFRQGNWYVFQSSNNGLLSQSFGTSGDTPVAGDYDGDGKTDFAVYRSGAQSAWYIRKSSNGALAISQWGANGDQAVPGDYDGDFKTDVAVWRASTGYWYIYRSTNGSLLAQQWGSLSFNDVAAPGDYDGDGKADIAIWRPGTGYWYISRSSDSALAFQRWGQDGDRPSPAALIY